MHDIERDDEFDEIEDSAPEDFDDDEVFDRDEVNSVVTALEDLMAKVKSATIRDYLECTCIDIAYLIEADDADEAEAA